LLIENEKGDEFVVWLPRPAGFVHCTLVIRKNFGFGFLFIFLCVILFL